MVHKIRNTRYFNIENDLKAKMRVKGRFPIPDEIKITKEHQINDENIILRADSLIESAYDSDKGREWVKNEDFTTPGILSPPQSEASIVKLYSDSDNDEQIKNRRKQSSIDSYSNSKLNNSDFKYLIFKIKVEKGVY